MTWDSIPGPNQAEEMDIESQNPNVDDLFMFITAMSDVDFNHM